MHIPQSGTSQSDYPLEAPAVSPPVYLPKYASLRSSCKESLHNFSSTSFVRPLQTCVPHITVTMSTIGSQALRSFSDQCPCGYLQKSLPFRTYDPPKPLCKRQSPDPCASTSTLTPTRKHRYPRPSVQAPVPLLPRASTSASGLVCKHQTKLVPRASTSAPGLVRKYQTT